MLRLSAHVFSLLLCFFKTCCSVPLTAMSMNCVKVCDFVVLNYCNISIVLLINVQNTNGAADSLGLQTQLLAT